MLHVLAGRGLTGLVPCSDEASCVLAGHGLVLAGRGLTGLVLSSEETADTGEVVTCTPEEEISSCCVGGLIITTRREESAINCRMFLSGADPVGGGQRGHASPPSSGKVPQILDQTSPESGQKCPICIKVPHESGQNAPHLLPKCPGFAPKQPRNYHLKGKFRNSLGEHPWTPQLHGIFCKSSIQMRTTHVGARREIAL